jgi:stage IV sporulation protein A
MLSRDHKIKQEILSYVRYLLNEMHVIKDAVKGITEPENSCIEDARIDEIAMDTGCVTVRIQVAEKHYYEMLTELIGTDITNEYELVRMMKELSQMKREYEDVQDAMLSVKMKGYGVVNPRKEEIHVDEPVIIKQGNKFGVKIRFEAPSIHMIRANIETEIAPIVGSEQQANDLIRYIKDNSKSEEGIWGTNIFGKSIEELLMDGMKNKIMTINDESQMKLQDTMQKIVNDSNGGMVCIII